MTNTIIGTGTSPSYTLTATGSGSNVTWASPNTWTTSNSYTIAAPSTTPLTVRPSGKIELQGEGADIEINGISLVTMLKRIEERLNILTVNTELESEWEELRELGEQYRALEQSIIEKMKTWEKLKAQDTDNR